MPVSPFTPSSQNIVGEGTGTGEALAKVIIGDQGSRAPKLPLLYLTGDKNRDTLPTLTQAAGLDLEPLQVYGTRGSPSFSKGIKELFQRHQPLGKCNSRSCLKWMRLTVCRSYTVVDCVLCSVVCRICTTDSAGTPCLFSSRWTMRSGRWILQGRGHRSYDGDTRRREVWGESSRGRGETFTRGSWKSFGRCVSYDRDCFFLGSSLNCEK